MGPMTAQLVVLASGSGSNLQAILDAGASGRLKARVVGLVSDQPSAFALQRAAAAGVPTVALPRLAGEPRPSYDERLASTVAAFDPDWVVLAGFMRLLTHRFLDRFPGRVVNLHPALPGDLPGTHAIERAYDQWLAGTRTHSGLMVHLVPDEGVDNGPVLATEVVPFQPGDTLHDFADRMHAAEHRLLVDTLITLTKETAR
jgi:phosphoribosylglycinamide formyltransferase 1